MDSAPVLVAVAPAAPHHSSHHLPTSSAAGAHLQSALINKSASIAALSPLALKKFHHNHILKTTGQSPKATRKSSAHSTPKKSIPAAAVVNNNYAPSSNPQEMESLDDMLRKVNILIVCYLFVYRVVPSVCAAGSSLGAAIKWSLCGLVNQTH